jgi:hypothetical protein
MQKKGQLRRVRRNSQTKGNAKGQVAVFLLIGIVLLLTVFMIYQLNNYYISAKQVSVVTGQQLTFFPPSKYLEFCVEQEVVRLLQDYSNSYETGLIYDNKSYPFLYTQTNSNQFLTFQTVANYLDDNLPSSIMRCFDTSVYENQGFTVTRGEIKTNTQIYVQSITIGVNSPIEIVGSSSKYVVDNLKLVLPINYGQVIVATNDALNYEIEEKWFDSVLYMHSSISKSRNVEIFIEKEKVYPHTIYTITHMPLNISLRFAIEGVDTFSGNANFLEKQFTKTQSSCCRTTSQCASDVTQSQCLLVGGFFESSCSCIDKELTHVEKSFDSCGLYKSGESWCDYAAGVGGRFMRHACVDGEIVTESCRDYKQEVCVSGVSQGLTQSYCRPNTAQNCFTCTDESCCSQYDCRYVADGVCVPQAPLGFKFWEADLTYCQQLASHIQTADLSVQDKRFVCSLLSDCGDTFSYIGDFSKSAQFLNSQSSLAYLSELKTILNSVDLSYSQKQVRALPTQGQLIDVNSFELFLRQFDDVTSIDLDTYLDPDKDVNLQLNYAQMCGAFIPAEQRCELCGTGSIPCSEYSCKSLGDCSYNLQNGVHVCTDSNFIYPGDLSNVRFANHTTKSDRTLNLLSFQTEHIFKLDDPVKVTFQTPVDSLCKYSFIPTTFKENSFAPISTTYQTNHILSLPLVGASVPIKLANYFSQTNALDLAQELVNVRYKLEQLQLRYPQISRFHPPIFTALTKFVDTYTGPYNLVMQAVLKDLYDNQKMSIFISCIDRTGAQSNIILAQFPFSLECQDTLQVSILGDAQDVNTLANAQTVSESNRSTSDIFLVSESLFVYTAVLSDCRYANNSLTLFSEMQNATCAKDIYSLTPNGYECSIPFTNNTIYVQCEERTHVDYDFNILVSIKDGAYLDSAQANMSDVGTTQNLINSANNGADTLDVALDVQVSDAPAEEKTSDGTQSTSATDAINSHLLEAELLEATQQASGVVNNTIVISDFKTMSGTYTQFANANVQLVFPQPTSCSIFDEALSCSADSCVLPFVGEKKYSIDCHTIPRALSCNTLSNRQSELIEVNMQKPPEFRFDAFIVDGSLSIISSTQDVRCSYRSRNANWIDFIGLTTRIGNVQTGLYEVQCIDTYGQKMSVFVSSVVV